MLNAIRKAKAIRLTLHFTLAALTSVYLFLGKAEVRNSSVFQGVGLQSATAQFSIPQEAWRQVYERLPNLPLENQYISKETSSVDSNNTLVSRLMRYHIYVKSRLPNYRFDWKLTMADYLGVYEYLDQAQYPSSKTLQENPMEGDRTAIAKLSRAERNALIDVLVSIFNSNRTQTPTPAPSASPPPPTVPNPRATPSLPKPGDAQLLKP
jgi:hypothetical protein